MKLAEALQERADALRKLAQLESRLCSNAVVQEGEQPAGKPENLMRELSGCTERLAWLIAHINLTNTATKHEGKSLTEMLASRDAERRYLEAMQNFLLQASNISMRATRTEIKMCSTVNVEALQKKLDERSKALRKLDSTIQMLNWQTELL